MSLAREITKLVKQLFRIEAAKIRTNTPCRVVSYDSATNLATIQPCIQSIRTDDVDNIVKTSKAIEDVPVFQFGSGKCLLTVAPQANSYGLYVVSDRRLENWITLGGIQPPGSATKHDLSSGFFLPGIYPNVTDGDNGKITPAINEDRIELRNRLGTGYVSMLDDGTVEINGGADALSLSSAVDAQLTEIRTLLTTWTVAPNDGGAALKAAAAALWVPTQPGTTGSSKASVDS